MVYRLPDMGSGASAGEGETPNNQHWGMTPGSEDSGGDRNKDIYAKN